jgi:hypothetical protein
MANPEEFQRRSQLMALEGNEDSWRRMPGHNRILLQGAAAVLTAPQLAVLSQMQSEQANQMQARIEQMRLQAGLDPQIPAAPDGASARTQRAGDVRVSIRLAIDRKAPEIFSQVVRNGSPATFDTGAGMSVDATPTLYEDGEFDLKLTYHEAGSTGRRDIAETRQMGDVANQHASLDPAFSGGSGSVIVGRRAYVVELDTRVEGI